jgi:hypothetical protein
VRPDVRAPGERRQPETVDRDRRRAACCWSRALGLSRCNWRRGEQPTAASQRRLSGTWIDAQAQANYSVQVNPDGSFSGSGTSAASRPDPGRLPGPDGPLRRGRRRHAISGGLQWGRQCHLNWRTDDGSGGQLHVNTRRGAPCPS